MKQGQCLHLIVYTNHEAQDLKFGSGTVIGCRRTEGLRKRRDETRHDKRMDTVLYMHMHLYSLHLHFTCVHI